MINFDERIYQIAKDMRASGSLMSTIESVLCKSVREAVELLTSQESQTPEPEVPRGMRVEEVTKDGSRYWAVAKGRGSDTVYFSMFVDGKPSWSKRAYFYATLFDSQAKANECLSQIRAALKATKESGKIAE